MDIANGFWIVGGDEAQVWSSAAAGFVAANDSAYEAFLEHGSQPVRIGSLGELRDVFAAQYPAGMLETYAAAKRYEIEVGGVTVAGVPVATDDRSKQMIMGARVAADADSNFTTQWAGTDGNIYPMAAAQIIAMSNAVLAHVAATFATYASVKAMIDAGTITTIAEIDGAFAGA
ncbi:MAG: DUF4376 domain-containing protein [Pseudomonadota bacterium]